MLVVFEAPGSSNVHVWALGLSCETGFGAAGASHDSPRAQTCTFEDPGASNTTNIPRRDTQGDTKRTKWWRERKNARNFGRSGGGEGPAEGGLAQGGPGESHINNNHNDHNHNNTNTARNVEAKPRISVALKGVRGEGAPKGGVPKGGPQRVGPSPRV